MSTRHAKLIRKEIRKNNRKQVGEFAEFFSVKLNSLPFRKRLKFAWAVVCAKVD